ncbi:MAG: peptide chain release factor 1 [Deltaproteobacteria bacterium]|nr:peptide chain release factor 1 [Deltaproteobacteria bacterium]
MAPAPVVLPLQLDAGLATRLEKARDRYIALSEEMASPEVLADRARLKQLGQDAAELREAVRLYERLRELDAELSSHRTLAANEREDPELRELARSEVASAEEESGRLIHQARLGLAAKDPFDERPAYLEVRAGTGGEEASLFASEVLRMYVRWADALGLKVEPMEARRSDSGGLKEAIVRIQGRGAFGRYRRESGVHRVQRVPVTESQGRIHTSTITVAVLPEPDEVEVELRDEDLEITTCRSSGPGGQNVNKTDSAVRIVHTPTGLVVTCQDEQSQHKNKARAKSILKARLLELEREAKARERALDRKLQVGTGDRSERIRTYNFPQGRVTDHRIGLTLHQIDRILEGELDPLYQALVEAEAST